MTEDEEKQKRREYFESIGIDPKKVKEYNTENKEVTVIDKEEDEEEEEKKRERKKKELEQYQEEAGF